MSWAINEGWRKVAHDGRVILNTETVRGKQAYRENTLQALRRQMGMCCLYMLCPTCPGRLDREEATLDHEFGRGSGGGKRDDRIVVEVNGLSLWKNGAAHGLCNTWKGSRLIAYNEKHNARITGQPTGDAA